jgi:hypothetical protein
MVRLLAKAKMAIALCPLPDIAEALHMALAEDVAFKQLRACCRS